MPVDDGKNAPSSEEPPYPDPLAALTGRQGLLRFAIRGLVLLVMLSVGAVIYMVAGWAYGMELSWANPPDSNGRIPLRDEYLVFVEFRDWVPRVLPATIAGGALMTVATLVLIRVAAAIIRRPGEAMIDDFNRRLLARRSTTEGRTRASSSIRRVSVIVGAALLFVAAWIVGAAMLGMDPMPNSLAGLIGRGVVALIYFVILAVILYSGAKIVQIVISFPDYLLRYLMAPLGIRAGDVKALEKAGEDADLAAAREQWPPHHGTVLRLDAATSVFAFDPPIPVHRDRQLYVPWMDRKTGVEVLAATLLAVAVLECHQRGLIETRTGEEELRLVAHLPEDVLPEGLAKIVLGHHHVELDPGRTVNGTIPEIVDSWIPSGDEDPHWAVVETAIADLTAVGIIDGRGLDVGRLHAAAGSVAIDRKFTTLEASASELFARLVAAWDRGLRRRRMVDTAEGIRGLSGLIANKWGRSRHRLPKVAGPSQTRVASMDPPAQRG